MRDRVDRLGVAEPEIRTQGNDQISIQLPGVKDPAAAAAIIGKTAQLELFDLQANLVAPSIDIQTRQPIATAKLYDLLAGQQALPRRASPSTFYLFEKKGRSSSPARHHEGGGPREVRTARSAGAQAVRGAAGNRRRLCAPDALVCPGVGREPGGRTGTCSGSTRPRSRDERSRPRPRREHARTSTRRAAEPIVLLQFTNKGAEEFEEITRARRSAAACSTTRSAAGRGTTALISSTSRSCSTARSSRSRRSTSRKTRRISGANSAQITGMANLGEAKDLALVLQTGALPVEFRTLDQTAISATLGKDSLKEAKTAALVGLLAVAIFLLVVYRFLGVVAVIGLGIYAAFLYAAILLFNVTLTLPGIAGLVLTLGVAADANVVIFERIKEEVRAGRSVRAAIQTGYTKGFAHDRRRERRHRDHGARAVRGRHRERAWLRADAPDRYRDLDAHRGARDPGAPAVLAGFKLLDNPRFVGAAGGGIPRWLKLDFIGRRNAVVRDLRGSRRRLARRDRDQGPQPRHRLQRRHPARVQDADSRSRSRRCAPRRRRSARRAP